MAKGPAAIIIARHGARLDAADKTWHLTSPAPYDPPLTYGGWSQSKALGLRIAGLLHTREQESQKPSSSTNGNEHSGSLPIDGPNPSKNGKQPQKRRQRIVIHTSPYLRCVQTSTAIAAGISQFNASNEEDHQVHKQNGVHSHLEAASTENSKPQTSPKPPRRTSPDKIVLRIDAFLGEWLTPDYYEDITPPPNSTMMVAGAKADLLRRDDYVEVQPVDNSKGHFPGGWAAASKTNGSAIKVEDGPLPSLKSLAQVSPFRERASSQGSNAIRPCQRGTTPLSTAHKVPPHIYDPPVPSYAVSPSDPIPRGYVAHARDACIDVDYQWDSMREPQEWGDGGEYGDEWSTMHKRFRKGLAGMVGWYRNHDSAEHNVNGDAHFSNGSAEEEEEVVLILVTHGAGCNALLGAISNQPVLLDVGLASLSMAVRKTETSQKVSSPAFPVRRSSVDTGIPEQYEMRIMASLDHLRPGVDPAKLPQQANSSPVVASPSLESRRRFGVGGTEFSMIKGPFIQGEPLRAMNSSLGSMRRTSQSGPTSRLSSNSFRNSSTSSSTGLWSQTPLRFELQNEAVTSPGYDMVLNFGDTKPKISTSTINTKRDMPPPPPPTTIHRSLSQLGLWGPPTKEGHSEREPGPKRRWTVNERD